MKTNAAAALALLVGACAAAKEAEPPKSAADQNAQAQGDYPGAPGQAQPFGSQPAQPGVPDSSTLAPAPAPATAPPPPPADAPSGSYAQPPPGRAAALAQASNEIQASQRELDVAGGDCGNACRALGSMDRAAGRICGLAQSNDEQRRCDGAKARVYSARDKVKNTCGSCPDVSVDKSAPVPSR